MTHESDIPFSALPAAAMRGRGPLGIVRGIVTLASGMTAARQLLRQLHPAAILGTGGYVCVPLFLAARQLGIPSLIYLPDVVPGLAVRLLSRITTQVACSVEDSRVYLRRNPSEMVVTGYPVRKELFDQDRAGCRTAFGLTDEWPVLLIYGGSRGARSINRAIEALLPDLLKIAQIIHICGREGDEAWLRAAAERLQQDYRARYRLYPYLESNAKPISCCNDYEATQPQPTMVQAFGAAELTLCRSGASTMAELPAAGLPAVLVPLEGVHQDENADYMVRNGAAIKVNNTMMLGDARPQDGPLFSQLDRLLQDNHERRRMAEQSRALARPDAAHRLADTLISLATRSSS